MSLRESIQNVAASKTTGTALGTSGIGAYYAHIAEIIPQNVLAHFSLLLGCVISTLVIYVWLRYGLRSRAIEYEIKELDRQLKEAELRKDRELYRQFLAKNQDKMIEEINE